MALVDLIFEHPFCPMYLNNSAGLFTAEALGGAGQKAGWVLQAPKTGNIRKVHWRTGTVTTATDTDVRIETVDAATGMPSGTLFGVNTNGNQASASILANTWLTTTLTADAAVTKGDFLAVVIAPGGTPNYQLAWRFLGSSDVVGMPYHVDFEAAWLKETSSGITLCFALEYDDGTFAFIPNTYPTTGGTATTFNSGSTPDEYALRFTMPVGCQVAGFYMYIDLDADADAVLYEGTTALKTVTLDKDRRATAGDTLKRFLFDTPVTLAAGTVYRLAIKPGASSIDVTVFDFFSNAMLGQISGGTGTYLSTRTDAGAWSDDTNSRPLFGLIISALDTSAGGPNAVTFLG